MEHADDACRALVGRLLEAELLHGLVVGPDPRHRDRAGVRHVGEQRSERDDRGRAELARHADHDLGVLAPAQRRFDALEQQQVVVGARDGRSVEGVGRPLDHARLPLVHPHVRTDGGEVVELLRVDPRDLAGFERLDQEPECRRRGLTGVVPPLERAYQRWAAQLRALAPLDVSHQGPPYRGAPAGTPNSAGRPGGAARLAGCQQSPRSACR
jgi:hypothetical protein